MQGFYSPGFPVRSVIYPDMVGKVTPEDRYYFPTGSVKVAPEGRYYFPTGSVILPHGVVNRWTLPHPARTFPGNTAVRRYLFHQRRHRTVRCRQLKGSRFPTGSVLFACRVGIRSLLLFTWSVSPRGCIPASPQGRYSRGEAMFPELRRHGVLRSSHIRVS